MHRLAMLLIFSALLANVAMFASDRKDAPETITISNHENVQSEETPAPEFPEGRDPAGERGLPEPKPERINERPKPAKGAVGYIAEFHVYRRTFTDEVAVGPPVSQEMKVYSRFFPWSRDHGEIARFFKQPDPIVVKDMQCQIRISENAFGVSGFSVNKRGVARQLYHKTHSLELHPAKASNPHILKALGGGLIYLQHPTQPTEMQIFVELTPVVRGDAEG